MLKILCSLCWICLALFAEEGKPIRVYADITGDLFHAGHVAFFQKARALGDYLIIGVLAGLYDLFFVA